VKARWCLPDRDAPLDLTRDAGREDAPIGGRRRWTSCWRGCCGGGKLRGCGLDPDAANASGGDRARTAPGGRRRSRCHATSGGRLQPWCTRGTTRPRRLDPRLRKGELVASGADCLASRRRSTCASAEVARKEQRSTQGTQSRTAPRGRSSRRSRSTKHGRAGARGGPARGHGNGKILRCAQGARGRPAPDAPAHPAVEERASTRRTGALRNILALPPEHGRRPRRRDDGCPWSSFSPDDLKARISAGRAAIRAPRDPHRDRIIIAATPGAVV